MPPPIVLAALVAVAAALYSVCARTAGQHVDSLFGAIVISATALVAELSLLIARGGATPLLQSRRGIVFAVLAGFCAVGIDYFTLKAYASGLRITIGAPIIIGGGIACSTLAGLLLGEHMSLARAGGVLLVIGGAVILGVSGGK